MKRPAGISKKLFPIGIFLFLIYFCSLWLYKLNTLPGLHADEAWFGVKACQFKVSGIHSLYGMNNYTGILQSLVSYWLFKLAGTGVWQLRIPGVFFNLLALIILGTTFLIHKNRRILIFFLLIFSQSAMYLIFPRVAWEVNTFTLFFISLLTVSVIHILEDIKVCRTFWMVLFLLVNLIGTYNHILFSCISLSGLMAVILWSAYNKTLYLKNVIILLSFNMLNIGSLIIAMRFWPSIFTFSLSYVPVLSIVILIWLEITFFKKLSGAKMPKRLISGINGNLIYLFLGILFISFIVFHGMGIYDVISDYKIIIRVYSYQFTSIMKILFLTGGSVVCIYLFIFLVEDLKNKRSSLFAFFIITYLGLLSIYTTKCSFRYYLVIDAIICLYLAFKMNERIKRSMPLIISLVGMFCLVNISFYRIYHYRDRPLRATHITIGNGQEESSAHFLPNTPLLDFLKKNKTDQIYYLSDQYFLGEPILFYRLIRPWKRSPGNVVIIGYDYSDNDHGGYLLYRKEYTNP